jgi:hypothetical protein
LVCSSGALTHFFEIRKKIWIFSDVDAHLVFFEERAGGADLHAFAATGAGVGGAPRLFKIGDEAGVDAAALEVPGVRTFNFSANTDAAGA